MKPAPFVHHAPRIVDEAVAKLTELGPLDGRVLAGGQSLVPMTAFRMARPAHLIDINAVAGLDRLAVEGNTLSIAACVRHAAFHRPVVSGPLISAVAVRGPLLSLTVPLAAPILFRLAPHRRGRRVFDLEPMVDPAGSVQRPELFRQCDAKYPSAP